MCSIEVAGGDAAGLRAVLEGASDGDEIVVGGGTYAFTSAIAVAPKRLRVLGQGRNDTILTWGTSASNGLQLAGDATLTDIEFDSLSIEASGASSNPLDGVSWVTDANPAHTLSGLSFRNCDFSGWRTGLRLLGDPAAPFSNVNVENCTASANRQYGMRTENGSGLRLWKNAIGSCGNCGIYAGAVLGANLAGNAVDGCNTTDGTSEELNAHVTLKFCHGFVVNGLNVTTLRTATSATKLCLLVSNCGAGLVQGLNADTTTYKADNRVLRLVNAKGTSIMPIGYNYQVFDELQVVSVDATSKYSLFFPFTCAVHPTSFNAP